MEMTLKHSLHTRINASTKDKVPSYLVNECNDGLTLVQSHIAVWQDVLNERILAPTDDSEHQIDNVFSNLEAIKATSVV